MMPRIKIKIFLATGVFFASGLLIHGQLQKIAFKNFSYVLSRNLDQAGANIVDEKGEIEKARYAPSVPALYHQERSELNVQTRPDYFRGRVESHLIFHPPSPGSRRSLTFNSIPREQNLLIVYGFSDAVLNNPSAGNLQLEVRIEDKALFRKTIAASPGLFYEKFDLKKWVSASGPFSKLTFTVMADGDIRWAHFYVDGYAWS